MDELCSTVGMSRERPPSLTTLQAFASAARHRQFRAAASELGVTPSAISHHVRQLETWVGAPLFERYVREVRLSELGQTFSRSLNQGFDLISQAVTAAHAVQPHCQILRLSSLPLFTSVWLMPRLAAFQALHPGITVAINTENRMLDFERDPIDVAIRNITAPPPGLVAHKLVDLHAVALAAPDVAVRLHVPADLAEAVLIHIAAGSKGWTDWLTHAGVAGLIPDGNLYFDTLPMALDAAAQGRGVVLAIAPFVHAAPQFGALVPLFDGIKPSAGSFFVVHRKLERQNSNVRLFVDWIIKEMKQDGRRLRMHQKPVTASADV
jgi:LysR family transcriptional regulator, glycine cleavage system transcriptional activator